MLENIVNEINKCLENECFIAALSLSLMLPDICGKAEFPEERNSKIRYINWFDEYIGKYERNPSQYNKDMPYIDGELIYNLRCNALHQGSQTINSEVITNENNILNKFVILIEDKNEFEVYGDHVHVSYNGLDFSEPKYREMVISLRRVCKIISATSIMYYLDNKGKFDFLSSEFKDIRKHPYEK